MLRADQDEIHRTSESSPVETSRTNTTWDTKYSVRCRTTAFPRNITTTRLSKREDNDDDDDYYYHAIIRYG